MLEHLHRYGWATFDEVSDADFLRMAESLGTPWKRREGEVEQLRIRESHLASPRSLSGIYGLKEFPLHTDFAHYPTPPRFVLLRNTTSEPIRPTLIHGVAWGRASLAIQTLERRVWLVHGGPAPFYAPIVFGRGKYIRWDDACMSPINRTAEALREWAKFLVSAQPLVFPWRHNRVLIIDNWRALHGRCGKPLPSDPIRVLERIVVS